MKPFLILQLRPNNEAADGEFAAFLKYGGLQENEVVRVRMEKNGIPPLNIDDFSAIIVGGGPSNVSDPPDSKPDYQKRFEADLDSLFDDIHVQDKPFLGSCYGFGKLIQHLGGRVSKEKYSEDVGPIEVQLNGTSDKLIRNVPGSFLAFGGHKEACQQLPPNTTLLAGSEKCPYQMIRVKQNIYATQFHAELDAEGLKTRILIYKNHGYFPPNEAKELIVANQDIKVSEPMVILRRFVDYYRQD